MHECVCMFIYTNVQVHVVFKDLHIHQWSTENDMRCIQISIIQKMGVYDLVCDWNGLMSLAERWTYEWIYCFTKWKTIDPRKDTCERIVSSFTYLQSFLHHQLHVCKIMSKVLFLLYSKMSNTLKSNFPNRSGSNPDTTGVGVSSSPLSSSPPLGTQGNTDSATDTPRRKKQPAPLVRERWVTEGKRKADIFFCFILFVLWDVA